jgi:hypothetical protein
MKTPHRIAHGKNRRWSNLEPYYQTKRDFHGKSSAAQFEGKGNI